MELSPLTVITIAVIGGAILSVPYWIISDREMRETRERIEKIKLRLNIAAVELFEALSAAENIKRRKP